MSKTSETRQITIGQKYRDNDPRANFPFLEVLELSGNHAICRRGPRRVRIRQERLVQYTNKRGYQLLEGELVAQFSLDRSPNGQSRDAKTPTA